MTTPSRCGRPLTVTLVSGLPARLLQRASSLGKSARPADRQAAVYQHGSGVRRLRRSLGVHCPFSHHGKTPVFPMPTRP